MTARSTEHEVPGIETEGNDPSRQASRSWMTRLYGGLSGAVGTIAGVTPHVLHHVGPIAGAAVLTSTAGSILFGAIGFVLTLPLLWRLKRRFGSWAAPGIALTIFAVMFTVSTLWIGPAVRDAINGTDDDGETPVSDPHHSSARPSLDLLLGDRDG